MRPLLLLVLAGCSLTTYDYTPCTTNLECRDAFGFGSVCTEDGLCDALPAEERCQDSYPEDLLTRPDDYRDAIVLGVLFDRPNDLPDVQAIRLAISQANDGGGLDGRMFALLECSYESNVEIDSLAMEDATALTARYLASEAGVPAILGPATSSQTQVAFTTVDLEDQTGTLIVSPSATSPALTTLDGLEKSDENPGLLWRTAPPDSVQGAAMANDMIKAQTGINRVAAIYEDGAYGNGLVDEFVADFTGSGRTVERLPFADTSTRDAQIQAAGSADYDEVLFISGEIGDITAFLNGAAEIGAYADMPIFLADGARDEQLLTEVQNGRALFDQVRGTAPSTPAGDVYDSFAAAYASAYNPGQASDSVYTAYSYDAAWLAVYGTAWAQYQTGTIDGTGIAKGLRRVSEGDPEIIRSNSWTDIRAHFEVGQSVDVDGASGHLDYDPVTEETSGTVDIWVINADQSGFTTVDVYDPQ